MNWIKTQWFTVSKTVWSTLKSEKAVKVYKGAALALGGIVIESLIEAVPGMDIDPQYRVWVAGFLSVCLNALRKVVVR
jgi:hypothetical protein